jgi:hypothetical protein
MALSENEDIFDKRLDAQGVVLWFRVVMTPVASDLSPT